MLPQINFLGRTFSVYVLFALFGALICGGIFCKAIKKQGLDSGDAIVFLFSMAAGAILGSHLQYAVINVEFWPLLFSARDFYSFLQCFSLIFGGSVFYGGLFGGMLFGFIYIKAKHIDLAAYSDAMAPIVPLFHSIARIGCFFAGCCYGIECSFGFASKANPYIPEVVGITRFPVQLLESALNFLLSFFLFYLYKKEKTNLKGKLFPIYLFCYSLIRFFDEFLRGDEIRGFIRSLSVSQFISILIFVSVSFFALIRHKNSSESK